MATVRVEDATVDLICFDHAFRVLGDRRQAARLRGYVAATLAANPGLAALPPVLPLGTAIRLPEFIIESDGPATVRLWD